MDDQAQMNGHSVREDGGPHVARSAASVWHDLLLLGELQTRLLLAELTRNIRQARASVLLIAVGSLLGLASLPVLLAGVALLLVEMAGMTLAAAFVAVAGAALLITAALVGGGWWRLRNQHSGIPRSRAEWRLNWCWLKAALHRNYTPGSQVSSTRSNGR